MASKKTAETETVPTALLDFATDEERAELGRLAKARDEAEREAARLDEKAGQLEYRASDLHQQAEAIRVKQRAALVAEALGEGDGSPVSRNEMPKGPGPAELKEAAAELRRRAESKRAEATRAHDRLRALTLDLFRNCAQRAAAEYLATARRLESLHAGIGAAQVVLDQAGKRGELVSLSEWAQQINVPTSVGLIALRDIGVEPHSFYRPPIVGGDEGRGLRAAEAACAAARAEIRNLVGSWPLDKRRTP